MFLLTNLPSLFGAKATWWFHAAAHDKGPCDGIGAVLKRLIRHRMIKETVQYELDPMISDKKAYKWACKDSIFTTVTHLDLNEVLLLLTESYMGCVT